jgi:hypothetical protein
MKRMIFGLLTAVFIPVGAMATDSQMTGDDFLQQNETQKEIYISDFGVAEDDLAECLEGKSSSELAQALTRWLEDHPDDLDDPAHESFAHMVLETCPK